MTWRQESLTLDLCYGRCLKPKVSTYLPTYLICISANATHQMEKGKPTSWSDRRTVVIRTEINQMIHVNENPTKEAYCWILLENNE
ncbi:hypothetical protein GE061_014960 [Apolygus lucorum]|uniref:Uncharacterized protein n=1 Tax=Apolygus lucorum TaxID=248454 RepID=A0A8S9XNQ6_APOLU|nr:hypothetical protein GE061_014960 [Apolygus lucorum]